jgi:hypothetical protein
MSEKKLFYVTKIVIHNTMVVANDSSQAEIAANKYNEDDYSEFQAWENFSSKEIVNMDEIPAYWLDKKPINLEDDEEGETCGDILHKLEMQAHANALKVKPDVDESTALGMLHGAVILKPPMDFTTKELYINLNVSASPSGIYFTTLNPLPKELIPFFVCYATRPSMPTQSKD